MSNHESPSIAGKLDRVTGKPATIYTPPEDLVGCPNVPVSSGARLARYAEALDVNYPFLSRYSGERVRAVMAVADQETAELRAEVERWIEKANEAGAAYATANTKHHEELDRANRLEAMLDRLAGLSDDNLARAQAAEAESARLASERRELAAQVAGLRSVVAKVEALRDRWLAVDVPSAEVTSWSHYAGDALRAAIASVGVSGSADDRREANASPAPDTATPGEADEWCEWCRHLRDHHPDDGGCVRGDPGEGWRCACAEFKPASSADDKAGEQR